MPKQVNMNYGALDVSVMEDVDTSYIGERLIDEQGQLRVLPYADLKDIPLQHLSIFCVKNGYYSIPTQELIDCLKEEIGGKEDKTIEIGSGNGVYARTLGIKGTDSYMQRNAEIKMHYEAAGQTIVPYDDQVVERIDGIQALKKYRPEVVLGAYLTHKYNQKEHWRGGNQFGVKEEKILEQAKKYIHIGNSIVHEKKPILKKPHRTIQAEWIISRSVHHEHNCIWIWEK